MKNLRLILALIVFTTFACKKQSYYGPQTIKGAVIDETTGEGIANAQVSVIRAEKGQDNSNENIATKYSAKDGSFSFDFNFEEPYVFYVYAVKNGYFNDGNNNTWIKDPGGFYQVALEPEGILKLHIKNNPPSDQTDEFWISLVFNYSIDPFQGTNIDTVLEGKVSGNKYKSLHYTIIENGQKNKIYDSIFCPAHDTAFLEILY